MLTKSYPITELRGVEIRVSILWVLVAGVLTVTMSQPETVTRYVTAISTLSTVVFTTELAQLSVPEFGTQVGQVLFGAAIVTGIYLSVLLHEGGHVYVARFHGIPVHTVTLWALGGAAQMRSQPTSAWKEFSLTVAGPIVSSILAAGCLFVGVTIASHTAGILPTWLLLIGLLNAGIALFNLLPAFPLDGGRIFRSVLTAMFDYTRATRYATIVAAGLAVFVGVISMVSVSLTGFALALFVMYTSVAERGRVLSPSPRAITSPDSVSVVDASQSGPVENTETEKNGGGSHSDSSTGILGGELTSDSTQPICVSDSEFVFWTGTEIPDSTLLSAKQLLVSRGGSVRKRPTASTDYIIVPDGTVSMYKSTVDSAHITLISATAMGAVFESVSASE